MYKMFMRLSQDTPQQTLSKALTPPDGMNSVSSGSGVAVNTSEDEKPSRLAPSSVVYWSRLGFAVLAGVVYNVLGLGLQGIPVGTVSAIGLGALFYAVSVFVVRYLFGYGEAELKGPRKHVSTGMGSYIIWLLFIIIFLNTVLNVH